MARIWAVGASSSHGPVGRFHTAIGVAFVCGVVAPNSIASAPVGAGDAAGGGAAGEAHAGAVGAVADVLCGHVSPLTIRRRRRGLFRYMLK